MNKSSSLSKARNYREIGEFWDTHDLAEHWDNTKPVTFEVAIESEQTYCAIDKELSRKLLAAARRRGVSTHVLINLWLQEKLSKKTAA